MKDTAKNADGDLFEIWRRDGEWHAEQITGVNKNFLGITAILHAKSRPSLLSDLSRHCAA